jgi:hypothetical protein
LPTSSQADSMSSWNDSLSSMRSTSSLDSLDEGPQGVCVCVCVRLSAMACLVRTCTSAKCAGSSVCPVWGFISKTLSAILFESGVPWHP